MVPLRNRENRVTSSSLGWTMQPLWLTQEDRLHSLWEFDSEYIQTAIVRRNEFSTSKEVLFYCTTLQSTCGCIEPGKTRRGREKSTRSIKKELHSSSNEVKAGTAESEGLCHFQLEGASCSSSLSSALQTLLRCSSTLAVIGRHALHNESQRIKGMSSFLSYISTNLASILIFCIF
jgi:hypothetical protein